MQKSKELENYAHKDSETRFELIAGLPASWIIFILKQCRLGRLFKSANIAKEFWRGKHALGGLLRSAPRAPFISQLPFLPPPFLFVPP